MKKLNPLLVNTYEVKPLCIKKYYESRMLLDHVNSGREGVIQINHGTVKAGYALEGATHEADEIYYILSGHGTIKLNDDVYEVKSDQVVFIPAGSFHALDNTQGTEDLKILALWKDYRFNDGYEARIKQWGKSFKTIYED